MVRVDLESYKVSFLCVCDYNNHTTMKNVTNGEMMSASLPGREKGPGLFSHRRW
jgi:hypothetical protein